MFKKSYEYHFRKFRKVFLAISPWYCFLKDAKVLRSILVFINGLVLSGWIWQKNQQNWQNNCTDSNTFKMHRWPRQTHAVAISWGQNWSAVPFHIQPCHTQLCFITYTAVFLKRVHDSTLHNMKNLAVYVMEHGFVWHRYVWHGCVWNGTVVLRGTHVKCVYKFSKLLAIHSILHHIHPLKSLSKFLFVPKYCSRCSEDQLSYSAHEQALHQITSNYSLFEMHLNSQDHHHFTLSWLLSCGPFY